MVRQSQWEEVMRKIAAASAALLALVFGLVTWTVVAQNRDRSAEDAPVRASLIIRHVVQEGENLTTDDGRYGPGGIMQHYLGRHRSGDIGRLRAYDGNRRVIWVARCDWPEEVPDEERTPLQDCPDAYARYSIRRSVGRVIEIPMRWIPSQRLAELTRTTPGIARDMRRIAAAMNAPGITPAGEDSSMVNEDPIVDAPVASAAVVEVDTDTAPDAGAIAASDTEYNPDAGVVLAGGTGGTGGTGTGGGEDVPSDNTGFTTILQGIAITVAAIAGLLLLIAFGWILWELTPPATKALRRRWTAYKRLQRQKAIRAQMPVDPNDNPEMVRRARDGYRDGNIALMAENTTLQQQVTDTKVADAARKDIERVLNQVGAQLHPSPAATQRIEELEQELTAAREEVASIGRSSVVEINDLATERQETVSSLEKRIADLEQANADLAQSIASGGRPAREDADDELANEETQIIHVDQVQGTPSIEPLAGSETSPGVGLAEVAGAPRGVAAPTPVRSTVGYEAMGRGDATVEVVVPRPDKVPSAPNAPPETDARSARQKRRDKRRGTP